MTRGKTRECPRIVVVQAAEPKFNTRDEAWQVIGPILARILAQTIAVEKQEQKGENRRQRHCKACEK
ncbi:MAG: hypothetical protein KJ077_41965 [Anaerolineae bacterium]|nr:hypothetical protein [Anaerolineae bacterium]